MDWKPLRSTKAAAASLTALLSLGGCARLVAPVDMAVMLRPIEMASTEDTDAIRSRAEGGDAQAQLALWLVLNHGMKGIRPSPDEANVWRGRALASRGSMPITQYTAAFNGQPSRINIINIPRYDVSPVQVGAIERCVRYLERVTSDSSSCGGFDRASRLSMVWADAENR